jgi:predicted kinase
MDLVILVGVPASGKTTFVRTRLAETHEHISKDNLPNVRHRDARQQALIEAALSAGRSVVVDNTNPRIDDRKKLTALARTYGARTVAYVFDVPIPTAIARNQAREGTARVPKVAIFTVAKRMERPTYAEDFDEIHVVSVDEHGSPRTELMG